MRRAIFTVTAATALWCLAAASGSFATQRQRSWRETDTETVYVGRYSNCDYGYLVLLPDGIVGHRGKAPSLNHGIRINLMNPSSSDPIPDSLPRYIHVYNAYNVGDAQSLTQIVVEQRNALKTVHKDASVSEPMPSRLGSLPAMEFRSTFRESNTSLVERDVVAYRHSGNILYHLQLLTTPATAIEDGKTFERITAGFRVTKLPLGECSND